MADDAGARVEAPAEWTIGADVRSGRPDDIGIARRFGLPHLRRVAIRDARVVRTRHIERQQDGGRDEYDSEAHLEDILVDSTIDRQTVMWQSCGAISAHTRLMKRINAACLTACA